MSAGTCGDNPKRGAEVPTGTRVCLEAYGPHAANVAGPTDHSDLFFTMTDAMGIKRWGVAHG